MWRTSILMAAEALIKAISKADVHRICAEQVVVNLATAVKELVENSLDAGARCVDIRVTDYGSGGVEVSDDGAGIEPANFEALGIIKIFIRRPSSGIFLARIFVI